MTEWWQGMLLGTGLVLVTSCIIEAIKEYKFARKMKRYEMEWRGINASLQWSWPRRNTIQPLFWNGSRHKR